MLDNVNIKVNVEHPLKGLEGEVVGRMLATPINGKLVLDTFSAQHEFTQEEIEAFVLREYRRVRQEPPETVTVAIKYRYKVDKKSEDSYFYSPTRDAYLEYIPYDEIM